MFPNTVALCLVGRPDYAQFGNRVHAGRAHVRTEANHADGTDDLLVGDVEYQCIMVVFTLSSLSAQVRAICVNRIKGSCPK